MAVVIGIFGALIGVYLREYIVSKNEKLKSVTILHSNLIIFLERVENNKILKKLMLVGFTLENQRSKFLQTGDDSKYKELIDKLDSFKVMSKTEELITNEEINKMVRKMKLFSTAEVDVILNEIDRNIEDIEHGMGILGRTDIKNLDSNMISRVLNTKRSIISILIAIKLLIVGVHSRDSIDAEHVKSEILSCIRSSIEACQHVIPLVKKCNNLINK